MGIIWYDVAALFILAITVYLYLSKTKLFISQTKFFALLVLSTILATVLDILTVYCYQHVDTLPLGFTIFINSFYYLAQNSMPPLYVLYVLSFGGFFDKYKKALLIPVICSWAAALVLILTNPLTKFIFYFDSELIYTRGPGLFVLYSFAALYTIFGIIALIYNRNRFDKSTSRSIFLFLPMAIVPIIIQFFLPNLLLENFGISLSLLLMSLTVQDFGLLLDSDHALFNNRGFSLQLETLLNRRDGAIIYIVLLENVSYLKTLIGIPGYLKLESNLIAKLFGPQQEKRFTAKLDDGQFVCTIASQALAQNFEEQFFTFIENKNSLMKVTALVHIKACKIILPEDTSQIRDIFSAVNVLTHTDTQQARGNILSFANLPIRSAARELQVAQAIERALENNGFMLMYQPILDCKTLKALSAEVLIRFKQNKFGDQFYPDEFIKVAEENGSIYRIGDWVLNESCRMLASLRQRNINLEKIQINLSMAECLQSFITERVLAKLNQNGLCPKDICLEITETTEGRIPQVLKENMISLANAGVKIAVDDFGTGYSNMIQLMHIPYAMIKIDKSLVWPSNNVDYIGNSLPMIKKLFGQQDVVLLAEGVETKEQLEMLIELGIDQVQGYHIARPMEEEHFIAWLQEREAKF